MRRSSMAESAAEENLLSAVRAAADRPLRRDDPSRQMIALLEEIRDLLRDIREDMGFGKS